MKAQNILLQKLLQNKNAHFYLINFNSINGDSDELFTWIEELVKEYIFSSSARKVSLLLNHEDVLHLKNEKKQYKLEELRPLDVFTQTKAQSLSQKVIIIENAHVLSIKCANKLLKTLEEPEVPAVFFLLNPTGKELIPTIESRAIKILLKSKVNQSSLDSVKQLIQDISDGLGPTKFSDKLKAKSFNESNLINELIELSMSTDLWGSVYTDIQAYIKEYQLDSMYNNTTLTRHQNLYSILKNM